MGEKSSDSIEEKEVNGWGMGDLSSPKRSKAMELLLAISHTVQFHITSLSPSWSYWLEGIFWHARWYQRPQPSHATPRSLQDTLRSQVQHGYLEVLMFPFSCD